MTDEEVEEVAAAILWLVDFVADGADENALVNCVKPAVEMLERNGVSAADFAAALERQAGAGGERARRVATGVRSALT